MPSPLSVSGQPGQPEREARARRFFLHSFFFPGLTALPRRKQLPKQAVPCVSKAAPEHSSSPDPRPCFLPPSYTACPCPQPSVPSPPWRLSPCCASPLPSAGASCVEWGCRDVSPSCARQPHRHPRWDAHVQGQQGQARFSHFTDADAEARRGSAFLGVVAVACSHYLAFVLPLPFTRHCHAPALASFFAASWEV